MDKKEDLKIKKISDKVNLDVSAQWPFDDCAADCFHKWACSSSAYEANHREELQSRCHFLTQYDYESTIYW